MLRIKPFVCCGLLLFIINLPITAQNRYALVIGNGNYKDRSISVLANPVNDATDMASALKDLGYNVTLKTNVGLRDMIDSVTDFSLNLRRSPDNEGFFWFAGHGLSVRGIHYMLPVDVDPVNDNIIARGSYSVDDLMEEIGNARNRTNLIVIDACRNTLLPGGGRAVGSRGLAVLAADDYRVTGNKLVYSTMAGRTAADGVPGSRNSPFAQAFIDNIKKPESFDDVFLDIANETMRLTRGEQQPYAMGSFAVKSYALNPLPPAVAAAPAPQAPVAPLPPPESRVTPTPPKEPRQPRDKTDFSLDGKRTMGLSVLPSLNIVGMAQGFDDKGKGPIMGIGLSYAFYEKYRTRGEFFYIPNSFYFSAEFFQDQRSAKVDNFLYGGGLEFDNWDPANNNFSFNSRNAVSRYVGFVWSLGAQYKIRLDTSQRFIANFGFALNFFTIVKGKLWETESIDNTNLRNASYSKGFDPGFGLLGGISYRLTPLISLDFGLAWSRAFRSYDLKGDLGTVAKGINHSSFGARFGVSFWWPR